jgi:hypothetical protein
MKVVLMLLTALWVLPSLADVATQVTIEKPFARSALQHQRNSAIFMQLNNAGSSAAIVSASSPAADVVELHTHIKDNGVMRMRRIPQIDLPQGQTVELRPGGLHVMLIGLRRDLNVGDDVALSLEFSDGSRRELSAPIHKVMRHGMHKKMGHGEMSNGMKAH